MRIPFNAQGFGMQSSKLHHSHVCFVGVYSRLWTYPNGSRMSQSGSRELSSTTLRTCSNTPTRIKLRSMLPVSIKAALVTEETHRKQSDLEARVLLWLSLDPSKDTPRLFRNTHFSAVSEQLLSFVQLRSI